MDSVAERWSSQTYFDQLKEKEGKRERYEKNTDLQRSECACNLFISIAVAKLLNVKWKNAKKVVIWRKRTRYDYSGNGENT